MEKVNDYNELFADLQENCDENDYCNAFSCISLNELIELNSLLDRLIVFCDNVDEDEIDDPNIFKLAKLADSLFTKDLRKDD